MKGSHVLFAVLVCAGCSRSHESINNNDRAELQALLDTKTEVSWKSKGSSELESRGLQSICLQGSEFSTSCKFSRSQSASARLKRYTRKMSRLFDELAKRHRY